jgi:ATP-dependent Clp protease ATP-binding subunit ClpA
MASPGPIGADEPVADERHGAGPPTFDDEARQAIGQALAAAITLHHNYVGSEHLLIGLCEAPTLRTVFDGYLSPAGARDTVELFVGKPRRPPDEEPRLTRRARSALIRSEELAGGSGKPVTARHLLEALLELDDEAMASRVLGYAAVGREELLARVRSLDGSDADGS